MLLTIADVDNEDESFDKSFDSYYANAQHSADTSVNGETSPAPNANRDVDWRTDSDDEDPFHFDKMDVLNDPDIYPDFFASSHSGPAPMYSTPHPSSEVLPRSPSTTSLNNEETGLLQPPAETTSNKPPSPDVPSDAWNPNDDADVLLSPGPRNKTRLLSSNAKNAIPPISIHFSVDTDSGPPSGSTNQSDSSAISFIALVTPTTPTAHAADDNAPGELSDEEEEEEEPRTPVILSPAAAAYVPQGQMLLRRLSTTFSCHRLGGRTAEQTYALIDVACEARLRLGLNDKRWLPDPKTQPPRPPRPSDQLLEDTHQLMKWIEVNHPPSYTPHVNYRSPIEPVAAERRHGVVFTACRYDMPPPNEMVQTETEEILTEEVATDLQGDAATQNERGTGWFNSIKNKLKKKRSRADNLLGAA